MLLIASMVASSLLITTLAQQTFLVHIISHGTIVDPNLAFNTSQPETTAVKPPFNIIDILTIISLTVTIAYGVLKISGRNFHIGSKKKPPYVVILKRLRQVLYRR